jgi:hypothetical protein
VLREIPHVRQVAGEPHARWFRSQYFELVVWCDSAKVPTGFQLAYDKPHNQRAVTWNAPAKYSHMAVDDGESRAFRYKGTPLLVASETPLDTTSLQQRFHAESAALPPDISALVIGKLGEYQNDAPLGA